MYSYVSKELPALIKEHFRTTGRFGIFGHSMGGGGALVIGLRNPDLFQSISALSPNTNSYQVVTNGLLPWDQFIGSEFSDWVPYDASELAKNYDGPELDILLDQVSFMEPPLLMFQYIFPNLQFWILNNLQGLEDEHLLTLLRPESFRRAVEENPGKIKLNLRLHEGFDHSAAYFVKTFIGDHFEHHARVLRSKPLPVA